VKAKPREGIVEIPHKRFLKAGAVGIFQTKDKCTAQGTGKKVIKKGGSYPANVLQPGRGWGVSDSYIHGIAS
jgi:hypothetical protein